MRHPLALASLLPGCLSLLRPSRAFPAAARAVARRRSRPCPALGAASAGTDPLAAFDDDCRELARLRPPDPGADVSFPSRIVSEGSSYTRIWTHLTWLKHGSPPHVRYARHVRKWPRSMTARKVLPTVTCAAAWSAGASLLAGHLRRNRAGPFRSLASVAEGTSSQAVALLSAPLALLLTLRANASMARLTEARQCWGRLVLHARGLANILGTHVYRDGDEDARAASVLCARHLAILGWVLKASLRGEDAASEREVLRTMLRTTPGEVEWMLGQSKRSVAVTSRVRQLAHHATTSSSADDSFPPPNGHAAYFVEERLRELEACVGACERLFGSPVPPTYSRHLSRTMSLWLLLTPLARIASASAVGPTATATVALATAIAAYVFVGLDEVGMEIENVFQLLPLQQLAAAAQGDVRDGFLTGPGAGRGRGRSRRRLRAGRCRGKDREGRAVSFGRLRRGLERRQH